MFEFSKNSLDNMADVDFRLLSISKLALKLSSVDFGIPSTGGLRTEETQNKLYLSGKSKCDGIIKLSAHQSNDVPPKSKALDFYAIDPGTGRASWDKRLLSIVGAAHLQASVILGYKIEWGGLWRSFQDYPHIQLIEEQ